MLYLLLALSIPSHAQGLRPKLVVQGQDTSLCFSVAESKQLAKMLTKQQYERKELQAQSQLVTQQQSQITAKSQIIQLQYEQLAIAGQKLAGKDSLIAVQERAYLFQQKLIKGQEKKLRQQRTKTQAVGTLGIIGVILALLLH